MDMFFFIDNLFFIIRSSIFPLVDIAIATVCPIDYFYLETDRLVARSDAGINLVQTVTQNRWKIEFLILYLTVYYIMYAYLIVIGVFIRHTSRILTIRDIPVKPAR